MPRSYTPTGNYAQNQAYRSLCAYLRQDRPQAKRRGREIVQAITWTPPARKLHPNQDPITRSWIVDRLPRSNEWQRADERKRQSRLRNGKPPHYKRKAA